MESLLKGGKPKDILNPMTHWEDSLTLLQKPSSVLKNPYKDEGKSLDRQGDEADEANANKQNAEQNKWLNWTSNRY